MALTNIIFALNLHYNFGFQKILNIHLTKYHISETVNYVLRLESRAGLELTPCASSLTVLVSMSWDLDKRGAAALALWGVRVLTLPNPTTRNPTTDKGVAGAASDPKEGTPGSVLTAESLATWPRTVLGTEVVTRVVINGDQIPGPATTVTRGAMWLETVPETKEGQTTDPQTSRGLLPQGFSNHHHNPLCTLPLDTRQWCQACLGFLVSSGCTESRLVWFDDHNDLVYCDGYRT